MSDKNRRPHSDAEWYLTHETEEDKLWYRIFFSAYRKFGVPWSEASEAQKALIEKLARINFEREIAKKRVEGQPI